MEHYFHDIVNDFPDKLTKAKMTVALHLFDINPDAVKSEKKKMELFYQFVARLLWGCL